MFKGGPSARRGPRCTTWAMTTVMDTDYFWGYLDGANLQGARYTSETKRPDGFNDATLAERGAIKKISPYPDDTDDA
jgi:hypothetical protein